MSEIAAILGALVAFLLSLLYGQNKNKKVKEVKQENNILKQTIQEQNERTHVILEVQEKINQIKEDEVQKPPEKDNPVTVDERLNRLNGMHEHTANTN